MEFRILGPLEVRDDDGELAVLPRRKLRLLLGILLLRANSSVPTDDILDELWDGRPPPSALANLQSYLSELRRLVPDRLRFERGGYLLRAHPGELDAAEFDRLTAEGRQALAGGNHVSAFERLTKALGLWRGRVLEDLALTYRVHAEANRLADARLVVLEDSVDARLGLGGHAELAVELESLTAQYPLRERFWAQLMLALYRAGRQADALDAYRRLHRLLDDDLGIEPGPAVQRLHRQILSADDALTQPVAVTTAEPRRPRQLPADVSNFTGRVVQLKELDELLPAEGPDRPAAVVVMAIAGTAGVGKTALAVHWAHRVAERFPDGQLYLNLRGHSPTPPMRPIEALAQCLSALGVTGDKIPVDVDQAAGLYRSLLAGTRTLVVLDNAADVEQVRPLLPGSPTCLVLVTSRDRLAGLIAHDGAHRLAVDTLTPEESRGLLTRILGGQRVATEPDAAAELARLCAHLPLALRIAAANLIDRPHQTIADYVTELSGADRLAALQVDGDEQTAVRGAFDLSYQALPEPVRRLFVLVGQVPGPDFTPEAVAALAGTTPARARRELDRLAGAHLVDHHTAGRYRCHDLLRLYARQLTDVPEQERSAALDRLYGWYLHTAGAAAPLLYPHAPRLPLPATEVTPLTFADAVAASAWLDAERPNLVAAITHAAEHGPRPMTWLLAGTLYGYFRLRRDLVDWLPAARSALAAAAEAGDSLGRAASHFSLGLAEGLRGNYPAAIDHHVAAADDSRRTGWTAGLAAIVTSLGMLYLQLGRPEQAIEHVGEALAINRRTGWRTGEAVTLNYLGIAHAEQGRLREATEYHAAALAICREVGDRGREATALNWLGYAYHTLGRLAGAAEHVERALGIYRGIGDRGGENIALDILARIRRDTGRYPEALATAESALRLAREVGYHRIEAHVLNTLASVQEQLGRYRAAADGRREALHRARVVGNRYPEVVALIGLASAEQYVDRVEQAVEHVEQALALAREVGYRVLEGQARTMLADLHRAAGHPDEAIRHAHVALDIHAETGHRLGTARTLVVLGHAEKDPTHWQAALAIFTGCGAEPEADATRALLG